MVALGPNRQVALQVGNGPGGDWYGITLATFPGDVEQELFEVEVTKIDVGGLGDPDPGTEDQGDDGDVALPVMFEWLPGPLIAALGVFIFDEVDKVKLHLPPVHVRGQGVGPVVQGLGVVERVDLQHDVAVEVGLAILDVGSDRQELEEGAQGIDRPVDRGRRVQVALGVGAVLELVDVEHDVVAPQLGQGIDGDAPVVTGLDQTTDPQPVEEAADLGQVLVGGRHRMAGAEVVFIDVVGELGQLLIDQFEVLICFQSSHSIVGNMSIIPYPGNRVVIHALYDKSDIIRGKIK